MYREFDSGFDLKKDMDIFSPFNVSKFLRKVFCSLSECLTDTFEFICDSESVGFRYDCIFNNRDAFYLLQFFEGKMYIKNKAIVRDVIILYAVIDRMQDGYNTSVKDKYMENCYLKIMEDILKEFQTIKPIGSQQSTNCYVNRSLSW